MGFILFIKGCTIIFLIWIVFYLIISQIKYYSEPEKDVFSGGEAGDVIIERSDGMKEKIMKVCMKVQGKWVEMPNVEGVYQIDENGNIIDSYIREKKNNKEKNMREIKVGDKIKIISTKNESFSYSSVIGKIYIVEEIREDSCKEKFAALKNSIYMPYLYNCELVDEKEKQFTKSDLKNGDIVELRNGERYVYIEKYNDRFIYSTDSDEVIVNLEDGEYSRLGNYDDDLRYKGRGNCEYDIMKILDMSEFYKKPEWTWERKKPEEMTLGEVCKELGRDIKIVKEH